MEHHRAGVQKDRRQPADGRGEMRHDAERATEGGKAGARLAREPGRQGESTPVPGERDDDEAGDEEFEGSWRAPKAGLADPRMPQAAYRPRPVLNAIAGQAVAAA